MAEAQGRFTERTWDQAVPGERSFFLWEARLKGLGARIDPNWAKTFGLRHRPKGHGARLRLNTVFMTGVFVGGSIGSAGATAAWRMGGWPAVGIFGAALAVMALGIELFGRQARRPPATAPE